MPARIDVLFLQRKPVGAQISIERLFGQVREAFDASVQSRVFVCPRPSYGIANRVRNLWAARRTPPGEVCHVVGDVHYLAASVPRRTLVLTVHDCAVLHRLQGWRREVVRRVWFEGPIRRAAAVTTISETTRQELQRWISDDLHDKLQVVPNCVRAEFEYVPKPFDDGAPTFLQVGTGWNKNLERVAEALGGTGARLRIVGPLSDDQRRQLDATGVVYESLGRVSDEALVEAYAASDALIFASLSEGFGLPILEAQAVGRPVITSDRSAMPEAAGDGALFVDPEDVDAIRAAALAVMTDASLRDRLVARGLENVRSYAPSVIAARYVEVYRRVAGR